MRGERIQNNATLPSVDVFRFLAFMEIKNVLAKFSSDVELGHHNFETVGLTSNCALSRLETATIKPRRFNC